MNVQDVVFLLLLMSRIISLLHNELLLFPAWLHKWLNPCWYKGCFPVRCPGDAGVHSIYAPMGPTNRQTDRVVSEKGLKSPLWQKYSQVFCIHSIKSAIIPNVSVCHPDDYVSNSPEQQWTTEAGARGANVPNISPGTSPLPSMHSKPGRVIREVKNTNISQRWQHCFHISLLPPALMSLSDFNYKVKAGFLRARLSRAGWVMSMIFLQTLADLGR